MRTRGTSRLAFALLAGLAACGGCTGPREYFQNGLKVGPDYRKPAAPVATGWIDAADVRLRKDTDLQARWWTALGDPALDRLIANAYRQNLSVREAGWRIMQSRADLGIARGTIFPQVQDATGSYRRIGANSATFFDQWNLGFGLAWELDFWGRFRRAIAAAEARLDASIENYDDVLVTLLADVAASYVTIRTTQQRIALLEENADVQRNVLTFVDNRFQAGFRVTQLDVEQAKSNLAQTVAAIPQLEITLHQSMHRLCVLLGIPPEDLEAELGRGAIPLAPASVAVGIPADLLRRRPDVRRAERDAAAQAELIGIAESDLYPAISVGGSINWQARSFPDLFRGESFAGSVGPSFQWNVLNYGRIVNRVRFQDARFQELVAAYQNQVLVANEEAENGIVTFLQAQRRTELLAESMRASKTARDVAFAQYEAGAAGADFNRYATLEQSLIVQQDGWAQAQGQIAQGLIQVYRALGGGWEIRLAGDSAIEPLPAADGAPPAPVPPVDSKLPMPPEPADAAIDGAR